MRDTTMTRTFCSRLLPLVTALSACGGAGRTVAVGDRIHHDDFEYSVQHVEKAERIGARAAAGVFYIVTFQVENRAGRVNHEWTNSIAYVVDERGRTFEHDNAAAPMRANDRHVTAAETTEQTVLVFDVPRDSTELYLMVRGQTLMGDVFDGHQFTRARVKLF